MEYSERWGLNRVLDMAREEEEEEEEEEEKRFPFGRRLI